MSTTWVNLVSAPQSIANGFGTGTSGQVLTSNGGTAPSWVNPATSGTVTSVAATVPAFLSVAGSPITSSGTLAFTLSGTALPIANGGTGATTAAAAFNGLSPMTKGGDIIYGGASGAATRLANGTAGQFLKSNGTTTAPSWANGNSGTVTSVAATVPAFLSVAGTPITTSGTLAFSLSGVALPVANGGTGGTTAAAGFDGLSPMTAGGDIIYGGAAGTGTRLANGTAGQVLTSAGGTAAPTWTAPVVSHGFQNVSVAGTLSTAFQQYTTYYTGAATTFAFANTNTLTLGQEYRFKNNGSGNLTITTSASLTIATILPGTRLDFQVISTSLNGIATGWTIL